jgi:large subunit ribosomal protein L23
LNLNKLDIRDYLFHAYGVRVISVRSYVQQMPVRQDKPGAIRPQQRRWFRPRAFKKMTIEMDKPFVWPDEPDDFTP